MSRYRGPRCRITRRLGELSGLTQKISKKVNSPGQHGALPKKPSQYSIRLQEKQKLRFFYGITEDQLVRTVKKARRSVGSTGEGLLQLLEMRLDTIIFRSGFAPTIPASRQLVTHGHFLVNKKSVNIPSYLMKPGDSFEWSPLKKNSFIAERNSTSASTKSSLVTELRSDGPTQSAERFTKSILAPQGFSGTSGIPQHIFCNQNELKGEIKQVVQRSDVSCPVDEQLIIEFYSRKI